MTGHLTFEPTPSGGLKPSGTIGDASLKALRAGKLQLQSWMLAATSRQQAGTFTAADRTNLQAVTQLAADLSVALARREASNEDERAEAARRDGAHDADTEASRRAAARVGMAEGRASNGTAAPTGRRYRDLFPQAGASLDGWASADEYVSVIGRGLHDSRLRAATMDGSTGSGGGFLIPPGALAPVWDGALEDSVVLPRATVWPITVGRERAVPCWDLNDRSAGSIAGLQIDWQPEAPATDADVQVARLRLVTLRARRGAIFAEASGELEADGQDYSGQLSSILSRALGYGLDASFLRGTGAESPLGVFNSPALISVSRSTANKIDYVGDVLAMFSRLSPGSVTKAIWLAHPSTLPELLALSIPIGTGGSAMPAVLNANGEMTLLGRPIVISEKAAPLGSAADLSLLDLSQYFVGVRSDATLERSIHPGFRRAVVTFRMMIRVDGMPAIAAPITPPHSAPTTSAFVTLAA
jgi:HK97 family phage major capsid protein